MDEYKPKRFEITKHFERDRYSRTVGIGMAREHYAGKGHSFNDYYLSLHMWWVTVTVVIFRFIK